MGGLGGNSISSVLGTWEKKCPGRRVLDIEMSLRHTWAVIKGSEGSERLSRMAMRLGRETGLHRDLRSPMMRQPTGKGTRGGGVLARANLCSQPVHKVKRSYNFPLSLLLTVSLPPPPADRLASRPMGSLRKQNGLAEPVTAPVTLL